MSRSSPPVPLWVVVGPTASGKTALACDLAEVQGGEIVGADSVQIYRRFDLGSGKPSAEERQRVPHHLVDAIEPTEPMDAARYATLADARIEEIRARGRVPIVVGGTFLWIRALLHGLAPAPPADPEVRARHAVRAEAEGRAALHAELARLDPESAVRLAPNDLLRVSRALEVVELTGRPLSAWHAEHRFAADRHPARLVGIAVSPEELTRRIGARVRGFLAAGWVDEVRALRAAGLGGARAMGSVGYRQISEALDRGPLDEATLAEEITRATRIFARRQRTWLREREVTWIAPGEEQAFVAASRSGRPPAP